MSFLILSFYLPALLIFTWLFLREPCDYPWSKIRKVLFACLLLLVQMSLVAGFLGMASFQVNMNARGTGQAYVADIRNALDEGKLSPQEIVVGIGKKYFPAADQSEWNAIKRTLLVRFVLVLAGWLLMLGILSAACSSRFKLKTLPFLLLFFGCAAGNGIADFYLGESNADIEWYHFRIGSFWDMHLAVSERILSTKDRLALRLAWEDVYNARIWDNLESDEHRLSDEKCEEFLSALIESLKKHESKTSESKTSPETLKSPGTE